MATGPLSRVCAASEVLESVDEESLPWTYVTSSDSPGKVGQGSASVGDASTYTRQGVFNKKAGSLSRRKRKGLNTDTTRSASGPESADWTAEEDYSLCQAVSMSMRAASSHAVDLPSTRLAQELQTVTVSKLLAECLVPAHDYADVLARVRSGSFRRAFIRFSRGRTRRDPGESSPVSSPVKTEDALATESGSGTRGESVQAEASLEAKCRTFQRPGGAAKSGQAKGVATLETDGNGSIEGSKGKVPRGVEGSPVRGQESNPPKATESPRSGSERMQQDSADEDIAGAVAARVFVEPKPGIFSSDERVVGFGDSPPRRKGGSRPQSKPIQQESTSESIGEATARRDSVESADADPDVFTSDDQSSHIREPSHTGVAGKPRERQAVGRARGNARSRSASSEWALAERPTPGGGDASEGARVDSESGLPTGEGQAVEGRRNVTVRRKRKIGQESAEMQSVGSAEEARTDPASLANVQPFGNLQGNKNLEGKRSFRTFRKKFLDRCLDMQHSTLSRKPPAQKRSENAKLQVDEYLTAQQLQQSRKSVLDACLLAQKDA